MCEISFNVRVSVYLKNEITAFHSFFLSLIFFVTLLYFLIPFYLLCNKYNNFICSFACFINIKNFVSVLFVSVLFHFKLQTKLNFVFNYK